MKNQTLSELANVIQEDWKNVTPAAKAYLGPLFELNDITDNYYLDSGRSVVCYFLANAQSWKGEVAREVKKELNRRLKSV